MASVKTEEYHLLDGRTIRCRYDRLGMAKISRENMESFIKEFNTSYRQAKILEKIKENYALMKLDECKKGKWNILGCDLYMCSKCYAKFTHEFKYCPNCGAKMVEPQESEDKK